MVDHPDAENVVVFINLSLFWYAEGNFQRAIMFLGFATNIAWLLGMSAGQRDNESTLQAEIRRRRFWSCYLTSSFLSGARLLRVPGDRTSSTLLPCSEADFASGGPVKICCTLRCTQVHLHDSIYAELIRAMGLWSDVISFIDPRNAERPETKISQLYSLDSRITVALALVVNGPLGISPSTIAANVEASSLLNRIMLHIIHHQCLCALHASVVPSFSGRAASNVEVASMSPNARQLSAQKALAHANDISDLLAAALALSDWRQDTMPSFVAYAAYSACAIQSPFLWCKTTSIRHQTVRAILANLHVIKVVGNHWASIRLLGRFAWCIYQAHASRPVHLEDLPSRVDASSLCEPICIGPRTRTSILSNNTFVFNDDGSAAKGPADVEEDDSATSTGHFRGDDLEVVIARVANNVPAPLVVANVDLLSPFSDEALFGGAFSGEDFNSETIGASDLDMELDEWIMNLTSQGTDAT
ncbi:hypothetical protein LTR17_006515 [Elasticomyces elasticus]|nr:hypothetical protein LTR17_006515 [Elasticomyces elasticus]